MNARKCLKWIFIHVTTLVTIILETNREVVIGKAWDTQMVYSLPVQRSCYWWKIINYISEKPVGDVGDGEVVIGNDIIQNPYFEKK